MNATVVRLVLVLLVFPTLAWVGSMAWSLVLVWPAVALFGLDLESSGIYITTAATVLGALVAFLVVRSVWPKAAARPEGRHNTGV